MADKMKLTMLGTGKAIVNRCYNTCFVISDKDKYFMVDGGGGNTVLNQLEAVNIDWKNIKDIFVTHKHMDHILGVVWMIRMICQHMNKGDYVGEARIYGHDEVITILKSIAGQLLQPKEVKNFDDRLKFVVVVDGQSLDIIDHEVTFFDIHSTKDKQFGFTMELGDGEKLACCGDEPYNETEEKYVRDAKWLLHEAFCLYSEKDEFEPYEKHHSTVKDACEMAQTLRIRNLILYHTEDKNIENRKALYSEEGQKYFRGNLLIPDDLETVEL